MSQSKKHILFLSSWFPTQERPFEGNFIKRHAEVAAIDNNVTVVHTKASNTILTKFKEDISVIGNLKIITIYYRKSKSKLGYIQKLTRRKKAFQLGLQKVNNKVDIVHGNILFPNGLQFLIAKKKFNAPLVITEQSSLFSGNIEKLSKLERFVIEKTLDSTDLFIVVSRYLEQKVKPFYKKEVKILPNVVDTELFQYKEKKETTKMKFLHISGLDERFKNVEGIIRACSMLKKEFDNFILTIGTDEDYSKQLALVNELHLENQIRFEGPFEDNELPELYQNADAFILNSYSETFSCVIAESWSTGTPVISTPVGIAINLNEDLGIQTVINDHGSLKEAMLAFCRKEVKYDPNRIRQEGLKYSTQEVRKKLNQYYNEVLK